MAPVMINATTAPNFQTSLPFIRMPDLGGQATIGTVTHSV